MSTDAFEAMHDRVEVLIDQLGFAIQHVGPQAGSDDPDLYWSYTVGMGRRAGWPELVMCFPRVETAAELFDRVAELDRPPQDRERVTDVVDGAAIEYRAVPESAWPDWFGLGIAHEQRHGYRWAPHGVIQVVWPDPAGAFPWDVGYGIAPYVQPPVGQEEWTP
jgi:hypothetical protein